MEKPFQAKALLISCSHVENEIDVLDCSLLFDCTTGLSEQHIWPKKMGWWWG
jgi:hypothetical protein